MPGCSEFIRTGEQLLRFFELIFYGTFILAGAAELTLLILAARALWRLRLPRLFLAAATLMLGYHHVKLMVQVLEFAGQQERPLDGEELFICLGLTVPVATLLLLLFGSLREKLPSLLRASSRLVALTLALALILGSGEALLIRQRFARFAPAPIPAGLAIRSIAKSRSHGCALTATGAVLCWGGNSDGQLGIGKRGSDRPLGMLVTGLERASSLAVGEDYSCALRDGQVLCWGHNASGRFGSDFPEHALVPTPVAGLDDVLELSTQGWSLWARKKSGLLRRLPARTRISAEPREPEVAPADTAQTVVAADFSCMRSERGTVSCRYEEGRPFPIRTPRVTALAAGGAFLCAVRRDGRVACAAPVIIKRIREDKISLCQQPQRAEAYAQWMNSRFRSPDKPAPPRPTLDDSCERQLDALDGDDAPPGLKELPDIADATAAAQLGELVCVATRSQGVRCSLPSDRPSTPPEFPITLAAVPGQPLPVFSSGKLSCALSQAEAEQLFCWHGPVGPAEQQLLNLMNPRR